MASKTLQSIRIRMYCQGFGDCFLVTFRYGDDPDNDFVHMMFDFGVWRDTQKRMKDVAADFIKETGGELDVLVITHEHKDHLSGFYKKMREQFFVRHDTTGTDAQNKIRINHLWLAWTEDFDNNPLANELRGRYKKAHKALSDAYEKLQALSELSTDGQAFGMDSILNLQEEMLELEEGWEDEEGQLIPLDNDTATILAASANTAGGRRKPSNEAALEWLKQNARTVSYFKPGQLANAVQNALPESLTGAKFYVLGPPESVQALKKNESSKEGDLYLSDNFISDCFSVGSVQQNNAFDNYTDWINQTPFEDEYCCPIQFEIDQSPDLTLNGSKRDLTPLDDRLKYLKQSEVYQTYFSTYPTKESRRDEEKQESACKRRIDYEWLRVSESLALDMNSHTNNTSLVLAIEIDTTKQVLLFPGDAQFGNWNSWFENNYQWQFNKANTGTKRTITVQGLLERTVFYKVSHHGSHNATPQNQGLKLMTRSDLVAMVPVSRQTAQANDWPIPYDKLLQEFDRRPVTYVLSDNPGDQLPKNQSQSNIFKADEKGLFVDYEIIIKHKVWCSRKAGQQG